MDGRGGLRVAEQPLTIEFKEAGIESSFFCVSCDMTHVRECLRSWFLDFALFPSNRESGIHSGSRLVIHEFRMKLFDATKSDTPPHES
jgi:hypothetical protein